MEFELFEDGESYLLEISYADKSERIPIPAEHTERIAELLTDEQNDQSTEEMRRREHLGIDNGLVEKWSEAVPVVTNPLPWEFSFWYNLSLYNEN